MIIGDIFFWSWKEIDEISMRSGTAYWCKDQYCVLVEDDKGKLKLIDTHKYNEYSSDKLFDYESLRNEFATVVDPSKVDLKFLGNSNDYEVVNKWEVEDYNEKDYLIIPCHSGYRTVYLRKIGAKKDKDVIISALKSKIESKKSEIQSAKIDLETYQNQLEKLQEDI